MRWLAPLLLCLTLQAEAASIVDKLAVGVYYRPNLDQPPQQLIVSGTPVEILKRQDAFIQVRLSDNSSGWVEARYVTEEKSARAMLLELQAENHQLRKALNLAKGDTSLPDPQTPPKQQRQITPWDLLIGISLLLLSFIAGSRFAALRIHKAD